MKEIFSKIYEKKVIILVILITSFLVGYFSTDYFYNRNVVEFKINFVYEDELNQQKLLSFEYLDKIRESKDNYKAIDVSKMIKKGDISLNKAQTEYGYFIRVKAKYFTSLTNAQGFIRTAISNLNDNDTTYNVSTIELNKINPTNIGLITIALGFLICIVFIHIRKKDSNVDKNTLNPFKKNYWRLAKNEFNNVKGLITITMLFAMMMVCKMIPIPSGFGGLGISLTYLIFSVIALIYGPFVGLVIGIFSDVLGFILFPSGIFFAGYTLNAMITGFIYGIFFYKTKITFAKILFARILVNLFVNAFLGSLWWGIISKFTTFNQFKTYAIATSIPKNVLYLLPQAILLYLFMKALMPILLKNKFVDEYVASNE